MSNQYQRWDYETEEVVICDTCNGTGTVNLPREYCPTCHGSGYELDSDLDAVPCGSCAGQDEPDDWKPSEETVAGVAEGRYPF